MSVFSEEYDTGEEAAHGDSPDIYVTYFIDEAVVIRAAAVGPVEVNAFKPIPWEDGEPLECFD